MMSRMQRTWVAAVVPLILGACGSSALNPIQDGGSPGDMDAASDADEGGADAEPETGGGAVPDAGMHVDSGHHDAGSGTHPKDASVPPVTACKRGIASNMAPSAALAPTASNPGVVWWYNWATQGTSGSPAIEFDPMIWGTGSLAGPIPGGSRYVMGFNEPNFANQSNLTPQQAAADWPQIEALAQGTGAAIVSPGVNFCSPCTDPSDTDPYTYLTQFFAACNGCQVDAIAVHWYNCDLPSLQAYIDGNTSTGGSLAGFVQFGKPIWLTEFSCGGSSSVAEQQTYMQAAIPYLENNPHVARYSWFSAGPIPNAQLMNADGSLTSLGQTYVSLPANCQ